MGTKRLLVAALGTLTLTTWAHAGVNPAIVRLDEAGPNYLYSAQKITPGDTIYFQFPKGDDSACCRQGKGKAAILLGPDPDAVDYASDSKLYRYRLSITGISTSLPFLGIAVIGNKLSVEQDGSSRVKARAGANTTDLLLCTSQEGVHLVSQSNGKQESHLYLYLGYDIENPTCTAEQVK